MKSYQIVWDEDEDKELIEPIEKINDDVLTTHMGMTTLIKNDRNRKINDIKDEDIYVDCSFVFGSAARAKILFSYCNYI